MAHFGFKTALFGFNKDEVNSYIENSAKGFSAKIKELEEKLVASKDENKNLTAELENLKIQFEELKTKADYYAEKEEEIEKMSVSIGTMYLVAKQNAAEVISNAEICAKEITDHSKKQLELAGEVNSKLHTLKDELSAASENFSAGIDNMTDSLCGIKSKIENQLAQIESGEKEIEVLSGELNG